MANPMKTAKTNSVDTPSIPIEQTNLREQLKDVREPLKGTWEFSDGTRVPFPVVFCKESAHAYALSNVLYVLSESENAKEWHSPCFAQEANDLASFALACALNCASSNATGNTARAEEWRSKCFEVIAFINGFMVEQTDDRKKKPTLAQCETRATARKAAVDAVFRAPGRVTRARTIELASVAEVARRKVN